MTLRVGIVTEWFERGSAYVSRAFINTVTGLGCEAFVYSRSEHYRMHQEPWGGENVWIGKYSGLPVAKSIDKKDFERWLETSKVDVVLFNEQHWLEPVRWVKNLGIPAIAYVDFYTQETVFDFSIYDGLICTTFRHFSVFSWHPNVLYCPWGTDTKLFAPTEPDSRRPLTFFHSFGWDPYRKGTDLLVKAFSNLGGADGARLVLHGQADLNSKLRSLSSEINSLIERNELRIVTETVPAPGLYHLGDVYVYPSRLEGIGLTMAEALASGLPLVATDNPPMSQFLKAPFSRPVKWLQYRVRRDRYFWPEVEPSVYSLQQQIKYWIENQAILPEARTKVREYALQNLDWSKNGSGLVNFLKGTIGRTVPVLEAHLYRSRHSRGLGPARFLTWRILGKFWRLVISIEHKLKYLQQHRSRG